MQEEPKVPFSTGCPDISWTDPGTIWCAVNTGFGENPALDFFLGVVLAIFVMFSKQVLAWAIDRYRALSGRWLLCILDDSGAPVKFDLYQLRHRKTSITGTIQRLVSLEDEEQVHRSYEMKGYTEGSNLVYSFWPKKHGVASFGTCTLKLESDNYFEGIYTRPYDESKREEKPQTAKIRFTRSKARVDSLTSALAADMKAKIERKLFR